MNAVVVGSVVIAAGWVAVRPPRFCWRIAELQGTPGRGQASAPPARGDTARGDTARRTTVRMWPRRSGSTRNAADDVAGVADLLSVAFAAGCSVHEAVLAVGEDPSAQQALRDTASRLRRGSSLEAALDALGAAGSGWHALSTVLALSASSGTPAAGSLRRLAAQERTRVRRLRERRARRLPVVLLLPLTAMVLPAFLLVTIVPFVLAGGTALELPPSVDTQSTEEP